MPVLLFILEFGQAVGAVYERLAQGVREGAGEGMAAVVAFREGADSDVDVHFGHS